MHERSLKFFELPQTPTDAKCDSIFHFLRPISLSRLAMDAVFTFSAVPTKPYGDDMECAPMENETPAKSFGGCDHKPCEIRLEACLCETFLP